MATRSAARWAWCLQTSMAWAAWAPRCGAAACPTSRRAPRRLASCDHHAAESAPARRRLLPSTPANTPAPSRRPRHLQVTLAGSARLAGSRQLALTLQGCELYDNAVNATGALAAQGGLDVTLKVLDSSEQLRALQLS